MEGPLRILLVDDSPFDRGMVRRELRKEFQALDIVEATNPAEFQKTLETEHIDLVITDFQIRWTDGLTVLREVRDRFPECPVVMFTATGNEEIAVRAMKSGLDDYVIKNAQHMVRLRAAVRFAFEHSRTRRRAQQLENRLASLLGQLRVGVFRRQLDGTITEANDAAASILGYSKASDVVGKSLEFYLRSFAKSAADFTSSDTQNRNRSVAARTATDDTVWLSISERLTSDENDQPIVEGLLEDITDQRTAEEHARQLQNEMARVARFSTLAEIASGLGHELNQPLSAIANYASVCLLKLSENDSTDEIAEYVEQIRDLAYQAAKVIRGIREFTTQGEQKKERFSARSLIDSTVAILNFELRRHQVTLIPHVPEHDVFLYADPVQIRQVMVNLISNAIDAMKETPVEDRRIDIHITENDDKTVAIAVTDRGCGIQKEQRKQLFEPFVTSKPDGTGIGLAISSRIVESHGGMLSAANNPDQGATFTFFLPLESSEPSIASSCK